MIRAHGALRADAACHSADVLTPTERAAGRLPRGFAAPAQLVYRDRDMQWGDVPEIREALMKLREGKHAPRTRS